MTQEIKVGDTVKLHISGQTTFTVAKTALMGKSRTPIIEVNGVWYDAHEFEKVPDKRYYTILDYSRGGPSAALHAEECTPGGFSVGGGRYITFNYARTGLCRDAGMAHIDGLMRGLGIQKV